MKEEVICPHCNKKKFKIDYSPTDGIKKLNGIWYQLLRTTGPNEWEETWTAGITIACQCGRFFFVHGLDRENSVLEVVPHLQVNYTVAIFCNNCRRAFFDYNLICPTCGTNY